MCNLLSYKLQSTRLTNVGKRGTDLPKLNYFCKMILNEKQINMRKLLPKYYVLQQVLHI